MSFPSATNFCHVCPGVLAFDRLIRPYGEALIWTPILGPRSGNATNQNVKNRGWRGCPDCPGRMLKFWIDSELTDYISIPPSSIFLEFFCLPFVCFRCTDKIYFNPLMVFQIKIEKRKCWEKYEFSPSRSLVLISPPFPIQNNMADYDSESGMLEQVSSASAEQHHEPSNKGDEACKKVFNFELSRGRCLMCELEHDSPESHAHLSFVDVVTVPLNICCCCCCSFCGKVYSC